MYEPLSPGIDSFSLVPLPLIACFGETELGTATGFIWHPPDSHPYLVTNWHVVSGRSFETKRYCTAHHGEPDRLVVLIPKNDRNEPPNRVTIQLLGDDSAPLWLVHRGYGSDVDIVALPISLPRDAALLPLNLLPTLKLKTRIGMPVFILGFPFGRGSYGFPVWKQGSIATEPYLSPGISRYMLVDSASRPGMSGSPVIQKAFGWAQLSDGRAGEVAEGKDAARLIGIYSGRLHTNSELDAQLGIVWPIQLVEEVVQRGCRDRRVG